MTSEVVVMNCSAVALAADSAATVSNTSGNKIFNSADKLFMLSKHHPVGVMVYSKATLLGVPWETILKQFRRQLPMRELPRLQDYTEALLTFLRDSRILFPRDVQEHCYHKMLAATFKRILKKIEDHEIADLIARDFRSAVEEQKTAEQRQALARQYVLEELAVWDQMKDATCYEPRLGEAMANRFSGKNSQLALQIFKEFPLDAKAARALRQLTILMVSKEQVPRESRSGLVIAGFGRDDHFPVMQHLHLGEVYEDHLKYLHVNEFAITSIKPAHVQPFAQTGMIDSFMTGIHPLFQQRVRSELRSLITNLPTDVIDVISDLSAKQKAKWKKKIAHIGDAVSDTFMDDLRDFRKKQILTPIFRAISHLPKDQLAHVAASLVNLNSFQKRMSLQPETVGGPIDVAVISKGDGFIWIERKHYFKPELNHHFFRNYYSQESNNGGLQDGNTTTKAGRDQ